MTPTGPRHPKLGFRWICFNCDTKFYDLGKEQPICPKCETDQRERPSADSKPTTEARQPKVVRPMAQLLDEEEPAADAADDLEQRKSRAPQADAMFDDAATADSGLDLEEPEPDAAAAPPEVDEL
ncbi:MAG: FYDLN acid domain-containing protein [Myxococcota bacterium]